MTPYEKRRQESKERQSQIVRMGKKKRADGTARYTQREIAAEIGCSPAYVNQVLSRTKA